MDCADGTLAMCGEIQRRGTARQSRNQKAVHETHEKARKDNREWTPMNANKRGHFHWCLFASIRGLKILAITRYSSR
jgi:hypothetical protein